MQPRAHTGHPDSWWVDSTLVTRGREAWPQALLGLEESLVEDPESHPGDLKVSQEAYAETPRTAPCRLPPARRQQLASAVSGLGPHGGGAWAGSAEELTQGLGAPDGEHLTPLRGRGCSNLRSSGGLSHTSPAGPHPLTGSSPLLPALSSLPASLPAAPGCGCHAPRQPASLVLCVVLLRVRVTRSRPETTHPFPGHCFCIPTQHAFSPG